MGNLIEKLRELNISEEDFVYLNYADSVDIWHTSDNYIEEAIKETAAASMLARALAAPAISVYSRYEEDVMENMRDLGLLDAYGRTGGFEDYLTTMIVEHAYEFDLLTISTERHDYKRGTCEVASNIKVQAAELFALDPVVAATFVDGWDVVVQTIDGLLRLA